MNIKIVTAVYNLTGCHKTGYICLCTSERRGNRISIGFTGDNTGDNISEKNATFCELTGLYWSWKNLEADYVGLVHYRRYFTRKEVHNIKAKKDQILRAEEWKNILSVYPVVVADKRNYYIETNRSHYNHAHPSIGLDETERIIQEKNPEYSDAFTTVMNRTWAHMFNMFVMRQDLFDSYCQWLFAVLFELEKRLDISSFDAYNSRVFGFVGERLLDVWIEKNQIVYKGTERFFHGTPELDQKGRVVSETEVFWLI